MKKGYTKIIVFSFLALMLAVGVVPAVQVNAAALPDSPTPTAMPQTTGTTHTLVPTAGSGKEQVIYDQVDTSTASQKRAFGGEQYNVGRFERPFDKDMNYLPFLDIVKSTLQRADPNFIYTSIQVADKLSTAGDKPAFYGLELDLNMDGRSELLILATLPKSTEWTVEGVNVWKSTSAETAIATAKPAIPVTGSLGFDVSLFASGKGDDADLVWVRMSPDKPDTVEIAFKNSLIGGEYGRFIWRPITDGSPYKNTSYDLNASFTLVQAGSPLKDSMFYPLKEVFAVDNTCRVASGFEANGNEPGLCPLPPPPSKPDSPAPGRPNPNNQPPA
jgi:hypothetical protein